MNEKELLYTAIALTHINKDAEKKADFNKVLADTGYTVDKLLSMTGQELIKTNASEVMNT